MATGSNYFRKDSHNIYLTASYCEFYIPMYYFKSSTYAAEVGDHIETLGIFDVAIFENGKVIDRKLMNIPSWVDVYISEVETRKVVLPHDDEPQQCKVLKYNKGAKVMSSTFVKDASNAVSYMDIITKGKMPKSVPYDYLLGMWWKNQNVNNVNLRVPSTILEMILSVSCRDKNNPNIKFAKTIGNDPKVSQFDYRMASIRQICQLASTFSAVTFEDIDSMITSSLNRTRDKKEEAFTPIENIIKY